MARIWFAVRFVGMLASLAGATVILLGVLRGRLDPGDGYVRVAGLLAALAGVLSGLNGIGERRRGDVDAITEDDPRVWERIEYGRVRGQGQFAGRLR